MDPFLFVTALVILVLVTVLVAAHELGHYLFARLFGMGVEEFSIGFGRKPLWTWMRRTYRVDARQETKRPDDDNKAIRDLDGPTTETTNFNVRAWPLGGFVRIKGMVPEEDGSEVNIPGGFYSKAPWQRFVVLLMGPVFSVLAGFAVLVPLLMIVGGEPSGRPVFDEILIKSPAASAGLRKGDRVVSIDGKPVKTWYEMVANVRDHGPSPIHFQIQREGEILSIQITPELSKEEMPVIEEKMDSLPKKRKQWIIGARPERESVNLGEAIAIAASMPVKMVASLAGVVKQPSTFKDNVGGPISIVKAADETAREGLVPLISFAGLLSISLGIFNLLPISPLDGGQMVVAVVEMLRRGRRLSFRVQNMVAGVGLVLIFALVVSVFAVDIGRLIPGSKDNGASKVEQKSANPPPTR